MLLVSFPVISGFALLRTTMPPFSAFLTAAAVSLSTMLASLVLYRISPFHPLARYPGPFGCKITKFWMACIGYAGRQHIYIKGLHERYGDVVRIGQLI